MIYTRAPNKCHKVPRSQSPNRYVFSNPNAWNVLHTARWKYRTQKIAILAPSDNYVRLYLRSWGMYRQSEKNC